ncbi:Hint domain-containing protein [Neptunicoccus cionae]|uniref:Hint domain-containing protein n=1 Tax=Neptunicoccus cionae TaxID=2035344 RepID=UPI000C75CB03|nr:Hint domain-containing protein [Amylibacter cionae]PLS21679.1 hypothetical protein C0U40_09280 [Amylibacter cionae]
MPATIPFSLQNVNGDPFADGGNINITTGTTSDAVFTEFDTVSLSNVADGDTITIGGLVYHYDYLGSHDVRGDPDQPAAYIRIVGPLPEGGTLTEGTTFAIDLTGEPGDPDYPNLQNGNTKGSVNDLDTTSEVQFPGVACFLKGTSVLTTKGEMAVEDVRAGDLLVTLNAGPQPVLWVGKNKRSFYDNDLRQKPVLIAAQALGRDAPVRDLAVSPLHKVLLVQEDNVEVLAPAKGLVSRPGIRRMNGRTQAEYFHILLPAHHIIFSEGLATESFYPGAMAIQMLSPRQRLEIEQVLPCLKEKPDAYGPKARTTITCRQAEELPRNIQGVAYSRSFSTLLAS